VKFCHYKNTSAIREKKLKKKEKIEIKRSALHKFGRHYYKLML